MALPILILLKGPPPALWFDIVTFINSVIKWRINEVFSPRKFHQTVRLQQQINSRKQPRHYLQSQPIHSPEHIARSRAIVQPFKVSYCSGEPIYSYHPSSTWTVCHPSKSTKWIDRPGKYPVFSGILHIFMLRQLNDYYIFSFASLSGDHPVAGDRRTRQILYAHHARDLHPQLVHINATAAFRPDRR